MGRQRKRDRLASRTAPPPPPPVERPLHDKEWRRAERRRIARLNRLPGPFRDYADRGRPQAIAVNVLQGLIAIAIGLLVLRTATGQWLPAYSAVVVLAVAVGLQAVCRSVNKRADARDAA